MPSPPILPGSSSYSANQSLSPCSQLTGFLGDFGFGFGLGTGSGRGVVEVEVTPWTPSAAYSWSIEFLAEVDATGAGAAAASRWGGQRRGCEVGAVQRIAVSDKDQLVEREPLGASIQS